MNFFDNMKSWLDFDVLKTADEEDYSYFIPIKDEDDDLRASIWTHSHNDTVLDLSNRKITSLAGIDMPPWLKIINLSRTKLTNLKDVTLPEGLQRLDLYGTELTSLEGAQLPQGLQELYLNCTELTSLARITLPRGLQTLNLQYAPLTSLDGVNLPQGLRSLDLGDTKLTSLEGVALPQSLQHLNLSCTKLTRLPESLRELKALEMLNLRELHLTELPDWLPELGLPFSRKIFGDGILLCNTTIEGVDMSIFDQPQEVIRAWFAERKKEDNAGGPLNEIKVVFLGDGSTGKSLTVSRLLNNGEIPKNFDGEATPGIAIEDQKFILPDGRKVQVHFWDFGGQEILHSMHRIFLTDRTLYVVMINARNNTQDDQARYWLHNVSSFAPDCPVLLVLNQVDQNPNASVNERSLKKLYPNLKEVIRLSALKYDSDTFNSSFTTPMLTQIGKFEGLDAFFPATWKALMGRLRGMERNFIHWNEFYQYCKESGIEEQKLCKELLKWFHDIGVSFCCSKSARLQDYVVLKPEWITNAIYTIIWNKRNETANGMVDQEEIYRLLSPEEGSDVQQVCKEMIYRMEDVDFILRVSRQFRLSFSMGNGKEFIPMLCQRNALTVADEFPEDPRVTEFRLEYEYLPVNVLHRLMVDMRQDLRSDQVWLTGALFEHKYNKTSALVKSEGDVLSIYIRATDPAHQAHTYLNTFRSALDDIHTDMGLKPPKTLVAYKEDGQTEYFSYKMLDGSRQKGQLFQYSELFDRMISIQDILNGTDSGVVEQKNKLLRDLETICVQIQSNRLMQDVNEDDRNDELRNALRNMRYYVSDQTHIGTGKTGKRAGSLDLQLLHSDNLPWTNIEAMNLNGATKSQLKYWDDHLNRLLTKYDPAGLPSLFLVSYVNCAPETFHQLYSAYWEHMRFYEPPHTILRKGTLTEILPSGTQYSYLRVSRCNYDRGGTPVTVYHYFVGFTGDYERN